MFKGGAVARSFRYFLAAGAVVCVGLVLRLVFDLASINTEWLEVPLRDLVLVFVLLLIILGFRSTAELWSHSE